MSNEGEYVEQGQLLDEEQLTVQQSPKTSSPSFKVKPRTEVGNQLAKKTLLGQQNAVNKLTGGALLQPNPATKKLLEQAVEEKEKEEQQQQQLMGSTPTPSISEKRKPHMFYPDMYKEFEGSRLIAEGEPQNSKVGGGKMMFISYLWPDGVQRPLYVQAPKMILPGGIMVFQGQGAEKERTTALCSMGKEWEQNPAMVAYRDLTNNITQACVALIMAKQLHLPYCPTAEDVTNSLSPLIFVSEKISEEDPSKTIVYPPSVKLAVNTASNNKSMLVTRVVTSNVGTSRYGYGQISIGGVAKGSSIIPMQTYNWVYRKKKTQPTGWAFSVRTSIYQAVIEPPNALGSGISDTLAVLSTY
jgi:hypothetical protein